MLDLHALYYAAGNTSLTSLNASGVVPAADGAVVAGVPILTQPGFARLVAWGAAAIAAADAVKEAQLVSNDLNDVNNALTWLPTGTSLAIATPHFMENLQYKSSARVIKTAQKAAAAIFGYLIDSYDANAVRAFQVVPGSYMPVNHGIYSQVFGGALTAGVWGNVGFNPTYNLPAGRYALLGFWASALTNFALVRFQHADFGAAQPGCCTADMFSSATTLTGLSADPIMTAYQGYQFVRFSEVTGTPQCPVFRAGPNGTGLNIWALDLTADTPSVIPNLAFLGA